MRLPDVQLACEEHELRWTASISSRHLVELPVTFMAQPPQDDSQLPGARTAERPRVDWQVTTPAPAPEPAPAPKPETPRPEPVAPAAGPERRLGAWQRFVRWWRGY
jgi:hypothetical protein